MVLPLIGSGKFGAEFIKRFDLPENVDQMMYLAMQRDDLKRVAEEHNSFKQPLRNKEE